MRGGAGWPPWRHPPGASRAEEGVWAVLQDPAAQLCPHKGWRTATGQLHKAFTPLPDTSPVGDAARGTHQSHRKQVLRTHQLSAPMGPVPQQASSVPGCRQPTQVWSGTAGRDKHPVPRTTAWDGSFSRLPPGASAAPRRRFNAFQHDEPRV